MPFILHLFFNKITSSHYLQILTYRVTLARTFMVAWTKPRPQSEVCFRGAASTCGLRSPDPIARIIFMPVSPVISALLQNSPNLGANPPTPNGQKGASSCFAFVAANPSRTRVLSWRVSLQYRSILRLPRLPRRDSRVARQDC